MSVDRNSKGESAPTSAAEAMCEPVIQCGSWLNPFERRRKKEEEEEEEEGEEEEEEQGSKSGKLHVQAETHLHDVRMSISVAKF